MYVSTNCVFGELKNLTCASLARNSRIAKEDVDEHDILNLGILEVL